jgi:hypothetical protein
MKRFITLLFTLYVVLLQPLAANASYFPSTQITDNKETAYCASTPVFTTAASATDIFNFKGSSTKTVYIRKIIWKQASIATGGSFNVYLLKRSTANSGGTSSAITAIPLDSNFSSATASGVYYTANPTTGASLGGIAHVFFYVSSTSPPPSHGIGYAYTLFDSTKGGAPIVLRGTSESVSVNYNGVTDPMGTGAVVDIEWSEK